ncbi:GNAT family N-acetyltransferase [Aquibacillus koreensis]|uniref:GNAT family N-acetyltransferase n=1 Tax=Aquibacillus koreensis TaxID=279446 RepID=A0A9X3WSH7_9BACI|nr:GNAT family N-acetyltransferase [Aquibacillus koreensis]MCT2536655.1 GNAT family N-acetyltransferase [Aquibacillus koreensis]MDC3422609.1 GNAT family N-acetyltransferase [Aquibacillus koreensis]
MVVIRKIQPDDLEAAINLSNQTFNNPGQGSMHVAFPFMFSRNKYNHSFGAFAEGKLVAFMGLVPFTVRVGDAGISLYALGSVCTDPDYQGQGIATKMLEEIDAFLQTTDASLLLVSGDRPLYRKVDCYPFGQFFRYSYSGGNAQHADSPSTYTIREMGGADLLSIARLASERKVAFDQSVSDLAVLLEAKAYANYRKLEQKIIVIERAGIVSGFITVGLPNEVSLGDYDNNATAIEWAGDAQDIVDMLDYAVKAYALEGIGIDVPWYDIELKARLKGRPVETKQNQGTIKVVHAERLLQQLYPYVNKEKYGGPIQLKVNAMDEHVEVATETVTTMVSPNQFVSLLFDPEPDNPKVKRLQQETVDAFPIPFPSTTGLNYT